ncbi:MAG TPA: hypothetical protein VH593_27170, partial [Ktedonobacteraceae bacterium]
KVQQYPIRASTGLPHGMRHLALRCGQSATAPGLVDLPSWSGPRGSLHRMPSPRFPTADERSLHQPSQPKFGYLSMQKQTRDQ